MENGAGQDYHIPALLGPVLDGLNITPAGIYADATFGGGGHSRGILSRLGNCGKLYGFDRDPDAIVNAPDDARFTFVHSNFRYMHNFLRFYDSLPADGILADLGVSFHHFDDPGRGFSFRTDSPLDMRMNQQSGETAAELLQRLDETELAGILRVYGELGKAGAMAKAIVKRRGEKPIATTGELVECVKGLIDPRKEKKELAQLFQALRIEVNGEMESLKQFLLSTPKMLKAGGRLAIITYHSLEDRLVKNFLKTGNLAGEHEKDFFGKSLSPWKLVTRQPIVPDAEEIERNPRSRSAKLRIAELTEGTTA